MLSGFSSNKLLPAPYTVPPHPGRESVHSPHYGVGRCGPLPYGGVPVTWNSSWRICFFSPFTNFFNHFLISGRTLRFAFYTEGDNPVLLCVFSCSRCFSCSHWELFEVAPVLPFLAPQDRCSRLIPYISCPVLESASSPGIPGSF